MAFRTALFPPVDYSVSIKCAYGLLFQLHTKSAARPPTSAKVPICRPAVARQYLWLREYNYSVSTKPSVERTNLLFFRRPGAPYLTFMELDTTLNMRKRRRPREILDEHGLPRHKKVKALCSCTCHGHRYVVLGTKMISLVPFYHVEGALGAARCVKKTQNTAKNSFHWDE